MSSQCKLIHQSVHAHLQLMCGAEDANNPFVLRYETYCIVLNTMDGTRHMHDSLNAIHTGQIDR